MYGVNDGRLSVTLVIVVLTLVSAGARLQIAPESAFKLPNETFSVLCHDDAGRPVKWRGPRGPLGYKTNPHIEMGAYGTSLKFDHLTLEDAGTYTCSAHNEKKDFVLEVRDPAPPGAIALFITQESAVRHVNETFFVLCSNNASRPVTWTGPNGTPLGPKTRPRVQTFGNGTSLIFNQARKEDTGTYTCSVDDEKKEYHLTIETPLMFRDTPSEKTEVEGRNAILRCEVIGGQATWSVDGTTIVENDTKPDEKKKYTILADGLLIRHVQRSDAKTYVCQALQPSTGTIAKHKIKLRVLHKPIFPHHVYAKVETAYGYVGGIVNLTCAVLADPPPHFQWTFRNQAIIEKVGRILNVSSDTSVLQLFVEKSSFGEYKCNASNKYGELTKIFLLEEGSKPNPPKSVELKGTNVTIQGPDLEEGNVQPGMEIVGYQVQYRPTGTQGWSVREFNITEDNIYPLDDLRHRTAYAIRAASRNAAGLSDYTNITIFTTGSAFRASPSHGGLFIVLVNLIAIVISVNCGLDLW